jgi:Holliday junction resolvase RusA-like endonuclease
MLQPSRAANSGIPTIGGDMGTYGYKVPLPPNRLSPNRTIGSIGQRMAMANATKKYRTVIRNITSECVEARLEKHITVHMMWYLRRTKTSRETYHPRDVGNAVSAAKALFDGIVDAEVIEDDTYKHLSLGSVEIVPHVQCVKRGIEDPHIFVCIETERRWPEDE